MNSSALRKLRSKLAADQPVYGLWITLDAPSVTEIAVVMGLDWIVIDAEHGHQDWGDIVHHLRSAVRSDTVTLVRIAEDNIALVKRALDIGADGVVVPWIETEEQLRRVVSYAHYPPAGLRGMGGERATGWGAGMQAHVDEADANVLVIPMIESVEGAQNASELATVDGVDIYFFGPADLSATAGYPGEWEGLGVAQMIVDAAKEICGAGKHCGVIAASNEIVSMRREQGFRILGLGLDAAMLATSIRERLKGLGRDAEIRSP